MRSRVILEVKHRGKWKLSKRGPELEILDAAVLDEFWVQVCQGIRMGIAKPHVYVKRVR